MPKLKQPLDIMSKNKHKTITKDQQPLLQIDPILSRPNKLIKHKNLSTNKCIKLNSIIHNQKLDIYSDYYHTKLKPLLKSLINNLNLQYSKSTFSEKNIPINIYLEDIDKTNLDPNFYYDRQKQKYQNNNPILGFTARIGNHDDKYLYINQITIHSNLYHIPTLIHEIGHSIDMISNSTKNYMSDNNDFKPILNLYKNELNADIYQSNLSKNYIEYLSEPTEIFARFYSTWYDKEIQRFETNQSIQNISHPFDTNNHIPIKTTIGEKIAYDLYEKHPEIQQFFTKHFGGIIPPENTKLFNKEKWDDLHKESTSQSDASLLEKLSNIMYQTGLSQKEQPSNDIDLDY